MDQKKHVALTIALVAFVAMFAAGNAAAEPYTSTSSNSAPQTAWTSGNPDLATAHGMCHRQVATTLVAANYMAVRNDATGDSTLASAIFAVNKKVTNRVTTGIVAKNAVQFNKCASSETPATFVAGLDVVTNMLQTSDITNFVDEDSEDSSMIVADPFTRVDAAAHITTLVAQPYDTAATFNNNPPADSHSAWVDAVPIAPTKRQALSSPAQR